MLLCGNGTIIFLWLLLLSQRTKTKHQEISNDIYDVKALIVSSRMFSEEVRKNTYRNNISQKLFIGKRLSYCDHEAKQGLPFGILKCGNNGTLLVSTGYCATIDEKSTSLEVGRCIYHNHPSKYMLYSALPKSMPNDFMCKDFRRTGTLCGKCQDGYYSRAYSYDMKCVQCQNGKSNWWKFVLAAFLPLTIFYIIILFFKVNIVSSRFQGFLFYSQMVSVPVLVRLFIIFGKDEDGNSQNRIVLLSIRCFTTLYGIWNLDFFRSINFGICLGTDTLQTLALELIVGAYPLLLMVVSYFLMKLYERKFRLLLIVGKPVQVFFGLFQENWHLRTSLIDVFATTFLLINVKFQSVSLDLLTPVVVYHLNATGNWTYSIRLLYDATVPYFGSRHLPYGIVGLIIVLLFAILPVLLLVLYPFRCFQKLLNQFPFRWYILHTFVDSFYGSYKDGTQPGTRDCRWFAALFILSRFCLMLIGAYVKGSIYYTLATMVLTIVALLFIAVQPFKENASHFTTFNAFFVLLLALLHGCMIGLTESIASAQSMVLPYNIMAITAAILPLLYISVIVLHWVCNRRKFRTNIISKLRAWRNGYDVIQ